MMKTVNEMLHQHLEAIVLRTADAENAQEFIQLTDAALRVADMLNYVVLKNEDVRELFDTIIQAYVMARVVERGAVDDTGSGSALCEDADSVVELLRHAYQLAFVALGRAEQDRNAHVPGTSRDRVSVANDRRKTPVRVRTAGNRRVIREAKTVRAVPDTFEEGEDDDN